MKKIMVLASVFGVALAVNAASFSWGFNGYDYVDSTGAGYDDTYGLNVWSGGKAFLYLGTVTASDSAFDFSDATYITSATFDNTYLIYGNDGSEGFASSDAVTSTAAGQAFSLILVDQTSATDTSLADYEGNYVLYTGTSEQGAIPGATTTYYATFMDGNPVAQNSWQTMGAVPEPTSGLLLLLGVAGLALKRKKA